MGTELRLHPRGSSARWCATGFNLTVGARLLMPDDILGSYPPYRVMHAVFGNDTALGLALTVFGLAMLASLYTDARPLIASAVTGLSFLTWFTVAVAIAMVNLSQIGSLAYLLAVAVNAFAFWDLSSYQDAARRR